MVYCAEFPDACIRGKFFFIVGYKVVQVDTAGLFFTFNNKLDIAG